MNIAAHQSRKDAEVDKLEIKRLKYDDETMRSKIIKFISSHQLKLENLNKEIDLQNKKIDSKNDEVKNLNGIIVKMKMKSKEYELKEKE